MRLGFLTACMPDRNFNDCLEPGEIPRRLLQADTDVQRGMRTEDECRARPRQLQLRTHRLRCEQQVQREGYTDAGCREQCNDRLRHRRQQDADALVLRNVQSAQCANGTSCLLDELTIRDHDRLAIGGSPHENQRRVSAPAPCDFLDETERGWRCVEARR